MSGRQPSTARDPQPPSAPASRWGIHRDGLWIAACLVLAALLVHLLTNGGYGYFRDELYYLDCGRHLSWGYVDHAPLIALVARASTTMLGSSLRAIRFLPAVAGALLVLLTGLVAQEFGGRRVAVGLACLGVLVAPIYLNLDNWLSMNAFEPLFWTGCAFVLILVVKRDDPRLLLWFGVLAGIGLENKHSMLFFGFALILGLLLTRERRLFASRWMWIAGLIALLIFLPNLIWQYQHGWPTIQDQLNVQALHKNVVLSPPAFLATQLTLLSPIGALVWVAGLWYLLFDANGRRFRFLGWAYLVVLLLMIALKAKDYYLAPAYPMLFAAGGVAWEHLSERRRRLRWLRVALPALLIVAGVAIAPIVLPILPPDRLIAYMRVLHMAPEKTEVAQSGPLPQYFGDQFGWPEIVQTVAQVYGALPADERAKTAILAQDYGDAGAIDFFGPAYGLPRAISGHQTYFFWGPGNYTGESMILLHYSRPQAERLCRDVEDSARVGHPYAMAEEHYQILICHGTKEPLSQLWPSLKFWN